VQIEAQSYTQYRDAMNYLRGLPGAISMSDWTIYFAANTVFDQRVSSSFPKSWASTYSGGQAGQGGVRLTNQAGSLILLLVEWVSVDSNKKPPTQLASTWWRNADVMGGRPLHQR
jgi:hypothetical protein